MIKNIRQKAHNKGMTLIEIIFAIAILGTVITLTYGSSLNAWRNAQSANQRTQAQYIAQDQVERLRSARNDTSFFWEAQPALGITKGFVDQIRLYPSFAMDACDGTEAQACTFKVIDSASRSFTAAGINGSDATPYTVTITPKEIYTKSGAVASDIAVPFDTGTAPAQIQAINFEITVTWSPATGRKNASTGLPDKDQLRAVTIITRKDVNQ